VREQQNKYYTGGTLDYVIAAVVALPLSLVAGAVFAFLIGGLGFFAWLISFFAAPATGGIIAEAVRWAVGRRRSRYLNIIVAGCLVVAVVPFLLLELLSPGLNLLALVTPGILLFLGVGTIVARLR
jgi:hypothetical protein